MSAIMGDFQGYECWDTVFFEEIVGSYPHHVYLHKTLPLLKEVLNRYVTQEIYTHITY